jgi:5-methylcytosine-specific restriction endonuclease McrA
MNLEFNFEESPIVFTQKELTAEKKIIHEQAVRRAQRYLVAEAELLESIIEADKNKLYEDFGLGYLTPYCVKHLGLSEDAAANFVRVARKTYEVPELKTAIEGGKLSITKAKTIASVITSDNQAVWIKNAETLSKSKLEKAVAYESPKSHTPEKAKIEGPNRVRIEYDLTEEVAQMFRRSQDILCQKKGKPMSLSETQAELLKCFLDKYDPVRKAKRNIKSHQSRDRSSKKPVDSKRTQVPAQELHKINLRDQGQCQALLPDGSFCHQTKWVHFHHITPKSKGGEDIAENLITLCSSHHRIWHARE